MPTLSILRRSIATLVLVSFLAEAAFADERAAAELLPPSTVIFAEIRQPQQLLKTVYEHPLAARVESLDQVRSAMEKKQYLEFKAAVAIVESQMGSPWRKLVGEATGGGIVVAVDATTQGLVILTRATNEIVHSKLIETLVNLASQDAKNKGNPDPVKELEYRGIKAYAFDQVKLAAVKDWLIVTNNQETGKQVVDRILDGPSESLAEDQQFKHAYGAAGATTAWGYVNTATLREAGLAKKLFAGQADNPLVELLFGGILSTLQRTPYASAGLEVSDRHVRLTLSAPYDPSWAGETREYFFGPEGQGVAPTRLSPDGTIISLGTYRDVSAMWLRAGDLFSEPINEELAKADSSLSALFAGKDFGDDILGALQPEIQLVVARQVFSEGEATPAIKLPAFGLVAELKEPARMQPELRRTFQSLIGFLNVVGAMNGQPQLDLDIEKTDTAQSVTSSYTLDPNAKNSDGLKINYNFSPSIAFSGSRFVIASTKELARALATANTAAPQPADTDRIVNTHAALDLDALRETLNDNRGQLVAQNMLSKGHTKAEAEGEIGILLELVGWFDKLMLLLDTSADDLRVTLDIGIQGAN